MAAKVEWKILILSFACDKYKHDKDTTFPPVVQMGGKFRVLALFRDKGLKGETPPFMEFLFLLQV